MLRRWWKRPPTFTATPTSPVAVAPAAPDLQALRDVYLNLFDVQRSHALIDVAINGTDAHYQSIILDVDPLRGSVAIDELFPAGFVGLPGQPVTVTVRLDGARKLTFNTHILVRSETQGLKKAVAAYRAEIAALKRRTQALGTCQWRSGCGRRST